jgi:hypothetical protein
MPEPPFFVLADHVGELNEALKELSKSQVLVGIPSDKASRTGTEPINNATLGYIHENGSPAANIPARPWLAPGVKESQSQWEPYLNQAVNLAVEGKKAAVDRALNAAGIKAVSAVKNRIVAGIAPPLAPATIAGRRRRGGQSTTTSVDTTPLVDTAQMLNSISYVIRKKR